MTRGRLNRGAIDPWLLVVYGDVIFYPYTDYTNYTDYTPYTRYTANPDNSTGNEIPAWLTRKINKRTLPILQAQSCNPAEYGG